MSYATIAELRDRLGQSKTVNDDVLSRLVDSASQQVNQFTGRDFTKVADDATDEQRLFRCEYTNVAYIDDCLTDGAPVVERRLSSTSAWETLTEDTDFIFEPINGRREGRAWPTDRITLITQAHWFPINTAWPSLRVAAKWGWPEVPAEVVEATLLQAAKMHDRIKAPAGTLGVDGFGAVVRVMQGLDRDARTLLMPFQVEISR